MSSKSTFSNSTANSYALALYELSKDNNEINKVEEGINSLNQLLKDSIEFNEVILNPAIPKDEKKNVIIAISDRYNFSQTLKKFLGFVTMKNRLFFLNRIIESFLNLISVHKGELKARLISSKQLSKQEQKKIQDELSKNFKSSLNIDFEYDPNLIAGLIIQVGSVMVDTSIKNKLKKLEKNMIEA